MPRYDYRCRECDRTFEVFATFKQKQAGLEPKCPACESQETLQLLSMPLVLYLSENDANATVACGCGPNAGTGCCS